MCFFNYLPLLEVQQLSRFLHFGLRLDDIPIVPKHSPPCGWVLTGEQRAHGNRERTPPPANTETHNNKNMSTITSVRHERTAAFHHLTCDRTAIHESVVERKISRDHRSKYYFHSRRTQILFPVPQALSNNLRRFVPWNSLLWVWVEAVAQ